MQKSINNPWQWQNQFGYAQAVDVSQTTHTLYCSGQAAMDADGKPIVSNMSGQVNSCFDNLETVLQQAGYSLANVIRLNFYTTSIHEFFEAYSHITGRMSAGDCTPASTLTEVKALAFPELMVEIEATAVR